MSDEKQNPPAKEGKPKPTPESAHESTETAQEAHESQNTVTPGQVPLADVTRLTSDLAGSAPEVNQDAIAQHQEEQNAQKEQRAQHADKRDKDGNPFDPEMHVTDADGNPKTNADGTLKKKRGRKKGTTTKSTVGGSSVGASSRLPEQNANVEAEQKARFTGTMIASFFTGTAIGVFGDEWVPKKTDTWDEQAHLEQATIEYVKATGMDMPPGIALAMAWSSYAMPRFSQPQTKEKLGKLVKAVKGKKDGAQSNSRNDGKRENDTSEKNGK